MTFQSGQLFISSDPLSVDPRQDRIYVHYKKRMTRIMTSDISYVKAHRAYCQLMTTDGREFTLSLSLGALERQLPPCNVIRIHRSYLVNVLHVDQIGDKALRLGEKLLPVSRSHREKLLARLRIV